VPGRRSRMSVRRLVRWAAVGTVLAAVAVLAVIASVPGMQAHDHVVVIAVVGVGLAGVVAAFLPVVQLRTAALLAGRDDVRRLLSDECYGVANGVLPHVCQMTDPLLLGVHPSVAVSGDPDSRVPSYVARDVDTDLRSALQRGGFVLVIGDSAAGKTRSAYEAIQAELPSYRLLFPRRAESLRALARAGYKFPDETVIWVNDLERYLGGEGLDRLLLERILGSGHHVVVLATLRLAVYGAYLRGESGGAGSAEFTRPAREIVEAVHAPIQLGSFGAGELRRARASNDLRVRLAAENARNGSVTAYLADGPALVEIWQAAWPYRPVAAALVAAAVDLRRAGMTRPIARDLLVRLYPQ